MRYMLPLPLLLLTQCAPSLHPYSGMVQPGAGTCDPPSRATLSMRGGAVQFAPSSGVLVLSGVVGPDGHIEASLVRSGADEQPYRLVLRATVNAGRIEGDYVTQRCHYTVHLTAVE